MPDLYAVIMAGGAGTRFWPASRSARPKQLLPLAGRSGETLIAASVRRILPICSAQRVVVVTAKHLIEAMRAALPELPDANFLSEPVPRNTAPCIGWAAATLLRRDPEAQIMVLPSDHFIGDEEGFRAALLRAVEASKTWPIATIGVTPTRPETGYGYIEKGERTADRTFAVRQFIEKPDLAHAEVFATSGKHLWNSGMFFFSAKAMLQLIRAHLPALASGLDRIDRAAALGDEAAEVESTFPQLPAISIDHGVMEKADRVAVVAGDFGWSDVGSWQSAWELAAKDAAGNVAPPGAILVDARGNFVADLSAEAKRPMVAIVGVDNLAVVMTDDALLVIPRERAQDVRGVIDELKKRKQTGQL
jgi:mannose-1-phosphate guanylyltransferase